MRRLECGTASLCLCGDIKNSSYCESVCVLGGGRLTAVHRLRLRFSWSSSVCVCFCTMLFACNPCVFKVLKYISVYLQCTCVTTRQLFWGHNPQSVSFIMSQSAQFCYHCCRCFSEFSRLCPLQAVLQSCSLSQHLTST